MLDTLDTRNACLIKLLADTNAAWMPHRAPYSAWNANAYFLRERFPSIGVPWAPADTGEAARKQAQRAMEQLADEGLVKISRPRRLKVLYAKLSDEAQAATRKLCGLASLFSGRLSMLELAERGARPPKVLNDLWISERELADPDPDRHELNAVTEMMLPALVAELAPSNSDGAGRVYFALTKAGWEALDGPEPDEDDEDSTGDPDASRFYDERLAAARERLETATPESPQELDLLPLPVALHGVRLFGEIP